MTIHVLIVEDSITQAMAIQDMLDDIERVEYDVDWVKSYDATLEKLEVTSFDVCLVDYNLEKNRTGIDVIHAAEDRCFDVPMIIVTATENRELDEKATKEGASGYLVKQFLNPVILERTIRYAIERKKAEVKIRQMKEQVDAQAQELEKKNDQMREDLDLAAEFQKSILPYFPTCDYLEFDYRYFPFDGGVSGDIYDVSKNRDGDVNAFIGDATGHGIAAAFMTMMIQIGLDGIQGNMPVNKVLSHLNLLLASRERGEKYVTGIYLRISPNGELKAAIAAHPPLIVIPADGSDAVPLKEGGLPLGVFREELRPYVEEGYQLQTGDKVILFTDGITETMNPDGKMYGADSFIQFLETHRTLPMSTILDQLFQFLQDWAGDEYGTDDITILGFTYTGSPPATN